MNIKLIKNLGFFAAVALMLTIFGAPAPALADTPLYATCTAIPYNTTVGDYVNWQAQGVTGGNGTYTYTWSGSDGLIGSSQTVPKTYTYPGTKTATVTITSGGQVYNATCSTNVVASTSYPNNYPYGTSGTLTASCYALPSNPNINDTVTWYGSATGGNGVYTYSWGGSDGLTGNGATITRSYSTTGVKTGFLTVYSNGQTITQTCSTNVGSTYNNNTNTYCPNGYYNGYQCVYNNNTNTYCQNGYYNGSQCVYNNNYNNTQCQSGYYYNGYSCVYGTTNTNSYCPNGGIYDGRQCLYPNPGYTGSTYPQTTYTYPTNTYLGGTPVAGVFLNQVPSTGISFSLKMSLFILGLFAWSLIAAYMINQRRTALATSEGSSVTAARIEAFKKANLERKK